MGDASGVKVSVDDLQLGLDVDFENIIWDFYFGQKLVDSYFFTDRKIRHNFKFTDDFEYIKVLVRSVDGSFANMQTMLTLSFLNECDSESENDQWLPISESESKFLVAKDFKAHQFKRPWIKLKLDLQDSIQQFSHTNKYVAHSTDNAISRSPYNYRKESANKSQPEVSQSSSNPKSASLRRRDYVQNMPMPVDAARQRSKNR